MSSSRVALATAIAGVFVAAGTTAWLTRGADRIGQDQSGDVEVAGEVVTLPAGSWVELGPGRSVLVDGEFADAGLDLIFGAHEAPIQFAHVEGTNVSLHGGDGASLGPVNLAPTLVGRQTIELRCSPPLSVQVGGEDAGLAEPVARGSERCPSMPTAIRANRSLVVHAFRIDDAPVPVVSGGLGWAAAGVALVLGLASVALLGPAAFGLLLASPLVLLAEGTALPGLAVLWLLFSAACSMRVLEGGWRRGVAIVLTVAGLVGGVQAFLSSLEPLGNEAPDADNALVSQALSVTMGISAYQAKVDDALGRYRPALEVDDPRPLIITLGSSSSGGDQPAGFWPDHLGRQLPEARVQTLAWGGATTWHMRKIMEGLQPDAEVCVLYMGHNDTLRSAPGRSIAEVERGEPTQSGFVAPVSLDEAAENVAAMATYCQEFVVVGEHSVGREATVAEWRQVVVAAADAHEMDVTALLTSRPYDEMMVDDVHPSLEGQRVLGEHLAPAVRALLEQQVDER